MAVAQTPSLSVSTAAVAPGATAALNLSLSGSAGPASLQWTLSYPAASVSGFTVNAGPTLSAAGKSLTCAPSTGTYQCLATGLNTGAIADGVIATVSVTPSVASGSITIGLSNTMAASAAGGALSVTGSAGAVTVTSAPSLLSSLGCNPASLSVPGTSSCTVNLSGPAPAGGLSLSVTSNNTNLTVPSSVVVPGGSASATFSASGATVTGTQNATVTVTLNGSSLNASLTLLGPAAPVSSVPPSSIACTPSSLAPGGSSTCTLILSDLAPAGGTAVNLISSSSALTVPASVNVAAGSSTTFTAQAASVAAVQSAVITASAMGTALTESLVLNPATGQNLLRVGPGRTYASPCQALTAAPDGALIQIDASGSYSGDVCTITANNITVKGINGRPVINAAGLNSAGQAAWVFQGNDITVDTIELTGAATPTNNGAAVFMAGQNLNILNSYIHDNQVGLLSAPSPNSQVLIQASEFYNNGFGDGLTHNIDIATAARLTLQYSYSHNANGGDLVRAQAMENYILFNRLTSEQGTTSSEIDLPAGGRSFVIGNVIEKGPNDTGSDMLTYFFGAGTPNPSTELYLVNNTMVGDSSAAVVNFFDISPTDPTPAVITDNIFAGSGNFSAPISPVSNTNLTGDPLFVNQAGYDYHLTAGSPAIDAGAVPGSADGVSLTPAFQYLDPTCGQARMIVNTIDIGAYEYGGAGVPLYCGLAVSAITLNPATVLGGAVTTANTVSLTVPAPPSGAVVTLTSSNPTVAAVPATVTIPSGAMSAGFSITTAAVTASSTVTITGSYSGGSQSANLTVAAPLSLSALQCSPTTLSSGASSSCKAILTAAAPAGGSIITLSASNSLLKVPSSVTVPAGSTSITFTSTAGTVTSSQSVTLTATLNGISKALTLNLTSAPVVSLSSFACTPLLLHSYQTSNCTIKLNGAAPTGGTAVGVVSNTGRLTVPSTVTVPAGATSATFTAKAGGVRYNRTATVTATLGSSSLAVKFQLSP